MSQITKAAVLFVFLGGGYYKYTQYLNERLAYTHPAREFVEMTLRLDNRVNNFLGRRFQITNYQLSTDDPYETVFNINLEGMKGKCRVSARLQKVSHSGLLQTSEQQKDYALLTQEEKSKSVFSPINFNDIIYPDEKTLHNTIGDGKEIKPDDKFYRISSLLLTANDKSFILNIRPIPAKYRDYNIEDTTYNYKTYHDVSNKVTEMKKKFQHHLDEDIPNEQLRSELISQRKAKFEQNIKIRKYVSIFNGIFFVFFFMIFGHLAKNKIDVTAFNFLKNKLSKSKLSDYNLICISYRYDIFSQNYKINGLMHNKNKNMGLSTQTLSTEIDENMPVTYYELK